jgi:integrase
MPRTVKRAKLENPTARAKLKPGRQPHWQELHPGSHLGYQRQPGADAGRWLLRKYLGGGNKYRVTPLGVADDAQDADGDKILSHAQVDVKARAMAGTSTTAKIVNLKVSQAFDRYVEWREAEGKSVTDAKSRGRAHILPALGDRVVNELTAEDLRDWLKKMADSAAQLRPKADGKTQLRPKPQDDEGIRKRHSSANRTLKTLKAVLNKAFDDGKKTGVNNRDEWGRRLKPFREVDTARVRYLSIAEAQRLVNGCDPDFRALVRGGLETGARYGELGRVQVVDFNPDAGTLAIRKSKTSKARYIHLNEDGAAFFREITLGRPGSELMFHHTDSKLQPWKKSEQAKPMKAACERGKIEPPIGFHGLRHTWASLSVMGGMPLIVVAENLGHKDTAMVEKHYGHLAKSYIADAIRAGGPRYGIETDNKLVPFR